MIKVIVRKEHVGGWSSTGFVHRAYREDGSPLYLGAETLEELEARVLEDPRFARDGVTWLEEVDQTTEDKLRALRPSPPGGFAVLTDFLLGGKRG
jgi:hypothetical protein